MSMKNRARLGFGLSVLALVLLMMAFHGHASAQTVAQSPTQVFVGSLETEILQAVGAIGVAAIAWAAAWAKAYFKSQTAALVIDQFDSVIQKSLAAGLQSADGMIRAKGWDHVDVKNATLAFAANYAVQQFPNSLKKVGFDPTDPATLQRLVDGALNRAFPEAAKLAAASPATPSADLTTATAPAAA